MRAPLSSLFITILAAAVLAGCASGPGASSRGPAAAQARWSSQTVRPINVRVVDQRPAAEVVEDPNYTDGYAYTTYGAEGQARNLALDIGGNIVLAGGAPAFRNLNAGEAADPDGLTVTIFLKHWYARWPMKPTRPLVLVEGEFAVAVDVAQGSRKLYETAHQTQGNRLFASMDGVTEQNYVSYIEKNLTQKGNQLLEAIINLVVPDLESHWAELAAAEGQPDAPAGAPAL